MRRGPRAEPPSPPRTRDVAERRSEDRRDSCLLIQVFRRSGFVNDADVGGDDLPALGESHPCLHLPSHPTRSGVAIKQRRGYRGVAAIACDHRLRGLAHQPRRRTRRPKRGDRVIAVEIFADPVAQRAGIVAEQFVKHGDIVRHQGLLIARELLGHLREHLGQIDVHFYSPLGGAAETAPARSSANATRKAMSSRQGAAMICTPIGIGLCLMGPATTGSPMKEIGWVWMPILARTGISTPPSTKFTCPNFGATQGVAGARITSTVLKSSSTRARYQRRNFCARSTSGAGIMAPASRRSRTAGSKSLGRLRNRSRCSEAPSAVVMTYAAARASAASAI